MNKNRHAVVLDRLGLTTFVFALAYAVSRVVLGVDFTDEMQHYGELTSFVVTGKFFQVDLFLQQAMYIFLYPIFWLHGKLVGGREYLVLTGRLVMAAAYMGIAVLAYRRMRAETARYPSWIAASLVLIWIPFNILSPYYNAMGGLLLSVIAYLWTGQARGHAYVILVALAAVMLGVSYPTVGLVVATLLVLDEVLQRRFALALRLAGALTLWGGLWLAVLLLHVESMADLRDALLFSRAFRVGRALSEARHILVLLGIFGGGVVLAWGVKSGRFLHRRMGATALTLPAVVLLMTTTNRETWFFVTSLYLMVIFYSWQMQGSALERRSIAALAIFGLLVGVTGGLTSGNGAINVFVGLGAVLPYLVGYLLRVGASTATQEECPGARWVPRIMLVATWALASNCIWHPYREELPWRLGYALNEAPAFRGIYSSREKQRALQLLRLSLLKAHVPLDDKDKTLMVVGPQPWMYFAMGFQPKTPMVFMHYSGEAVAHQIVARRMFRLGLPDYIVLTSEPPVPIRVELTAGVAANYRCSPLAVEFASPEERRGMKEFGVTEDTLLCQRVVRAT